MKSKLISNLGRVKYNNRARRPHQKRWWPQQVSAMCFHPPLILLGIAWQLEASLAQRLLGDNRTEVQ